MTTLQLPSHPAILAAIARLGESEELARAFEEGRVKVTPIKGGFLVQSFTGKNTYVVTDGRCSCPSRVQPCKHRKALAIIIAAQARPSGTSLPPVAESLARADALAPVSKHIAEQARDAYAAAALPAYRRPLFADRDAETMRRAALAEDRAALIEQRAKRAKQAAESINELFA